MDLDPLSNKLSGETDLTPKYPYGMKLLMVPKLSKFRRAYPPHEIGTNPNLEMLLETQVRDLLENTPHSKKEKGLNVK